MDTKNELIAVHKTLYLVRNEIKDDIDGQIHKYAETTVGDEIVDMVDHGSVSMGDLSHERAELAGSTYQEVGVGPNQAYRKVGEQKAVVLGLSRMLAEALENEDLRGQLSDETKQLAEEQVTQDTEEKVMFSDYSQ